LQLFLCRDMPSFVERDYLDSEAKTLHPDSLGEPAGSQGQQIPGVAEGASTQVQIRKKPKNIIRCGDGYLEEFSTDDEQIEARKKEEEDEKEWNALPYNDVDNQSYRELSWSQYGAYHFFRSWRRLQWAGYSFGSFWAEFMGITAPRYSREIREAQRMEQEEKRQRELVKRCYVGPDGELIEEMIEAPNSGKGEGSSTKKEEIRLGAVGADGKIVPDTGGSDLGRDNLARDMAESSL